MQYAVFIGNALRGDFGRSIHFRQPAIEVVKGYLGASVELGLTAFGLIGIDAEPGDTETFRGGPSPPENLMSAAV